MTFVCCQPSTHSPICPRNLRIEWWRTPERQGRSPCQKVVWRVPPKKLSFRLSFSLSDMTNYKSAFGKVCRIKNRHTFKSMPILNSAYFTECRRHIVIPCGKVCRIKNRHTFRILPILKSAYFKSMPILNSSYHAVKYAELRIGSILKVCRFVIRHITQTETQTETEANFTHSGAPSRGCYTSKKSWNSATGQ